MGALNYYYADSIENFVRKSAEQIAGEIAFSNPYDSLATQNRAWQDQISILFAALKDIRGHIFFEFSIPRMGKRADCVLIIKNVIFVIEFKVGETRFLNHHIEQVWDYALDLKNFHTPSHRAPVIPILIATEAPDTILTIHPTSYDDNLAYPIRTNRNGLSDAIRHGLLFFANESETINPNEFINGRYAPTPTIIEAAIALYNSHGVDEITRSDAEAKNLTATTHSIEEIINNSRHRSEKSICFVTGVPGAGKTLVGLKVATLHVDGQTNKSVYLSGNGPLVAILQEALTRDKVRREAEQGRKITKREAKQAVKSFLQNIHHYRDEYIAKAHAPYDHVAIFDEAQRAWNKEQTVKFMRQKRNQESFDLSEPQFLISCLDRHPDWATIVCLVGGGQEINTGEAGISEWLDAIPQMFPRWKVFISPNLKDSEYAAVNSINVLEANSQIHFNENLHLGVSMRSFRAENLSQFVRSLLDLNKHEALENLKKIRENYPIAVTREFETAKRWLKEKARGSERYGMIVSSQAQRLKPYAIDVKSPIDPVNWFLEGKDDVRSSFYLEDVATEFHIQGLELDWACVAWDGDLRYSESGWRTFSFKGNKWQNINSFDRKKYLINAYRVLLTRARQGMVVVVPRGSTEDPTRRPEYYDETFEYLRSVGVSVLE